MDETIELLTATVSTTMDVDAETQNTEDACIVFEDFCFVTNLVRSTTIPM
tara:strand:+ start:510 stop:659 length:150 start_codon:yes stop_codon:yes gene_type:complete